MSNSRLRIPTRTDFQKAIDEDFQEAKIVGRTHLDITSGELHRRVGSYPSNNHRMPICCSVMRACMKNDDVILDEPPKGAGATLKIRYKIPR